MTGVKILTGVVEWSRRVLLTRKIIGKNFDSQEGMLKYYFRI